MSYFALSLVIVAFSIFTSGFCGIASAQGSMDAPQDKKANSAAQSYAQVGSPLARVFTAKQHGGHNQNWTSIQSTDGLIYVGHTEGISQWDGERWFNYTTPHSTPVRSLAELNDALFFGTTNDIFKLNIDQSGQLTTESLLPTLQQKTQVPNLESFGEIWSTASNANGVIFVSAKHTFYYDGKGLHWLENVVSSKHAIFNINGNFYFKPRNLSTVFQIKITENEKGIAYTSTEMSYRLPVNSRLMEVLVANDNSLIFFTEQHGVFQAKEEQLSRIIAPEQFANDIEIYDAILASDGFYYVSSVYQGLFILDPDLNIVRHYEESEGISMNTLFSVNEDRQGNIWLTGIPNIVKIRPPHLISQFKTGNESTEILRLKNTNMGVFATGNGQFKLHAPEGSVKTPKFIPLSTNLQSSVDLMAFDGKLIRSGRRGIFELSLNQSSTEVISEKRLVEVALGRHLVKDANGHILAGTSNGAFILRNKRGDWQIETIAGSIGAVISSTLDSDDTLWLGSPTSQLYKIDNISRDGASAIITTFTEAEGLSLGPVYVFDIDGKAVIGSGGMLLSFNEGRLEEAKLPMLSSDWLNDSKVIDELIQTPASAYSPERIWYRKDGQSGYFEKTNSSQWTQYTGVFDAVEDGGMSDLFVGGNDVVWFVRDKDEIFRVDIALAKNLPTIAPLNIRSLESQDEVINFRGEKNAEIELMPHQTDIRLSYASTDSSSPTGVEYRTQLLNDDSHRWSNWSREMYRDFSQLSPKQYRFEVQARDAWGQVSKSHVHMLVIAPWYQSTAAYIVYVVVGLFLIFAFAYFVQKWRTKALEAANRELENKVAARTKEVSEKVEELRQQQILKDRFFGNVSHEFRTPLTLTIGPLETLFTEHKSELSHTVSHLAKTALNNASKMLALVGQVLDLNRLEAGRLPLRIAQYDIAELLRNISERFQAWASQQQQHIEVINCEEPMLLWFDMDQLDKCVSNLLSNAIKYSGDNTTIQIQLKPADGYTDILVRDNGGGISEEAKTKVFERFYQDKSSENVSAPGTGIGLALVKEIMEIHHGDALLLDSDEKGCCFVLRLTAGNRHFAQEQIIEPIEVNEDADFADMGLADVMPTLADNTKAKSAQKNAKSMQDKEDVTTLLIVDDNKELLNFISLRLSASYRILQANNGQEGYKKACAELPDLIISDVNMPIMTGLELAQKIKANSLTQTIPIILLTAKATKREVVAGFSVGADDYLTKPFDTSELIMRVNAQINARKLVRETSQSMLGMTTENVNKSSFTGKVESIIQEKLTDPLFNVEQLAGAMHTSRDTLIRKCKKEFGETPLNLIIQKRMQKADTLLHENSMSISEVAYACGFESLAYFSKSYKKHRGVSPSEVSGH